MSAQSNVTQKGLGDHEMQTRWIEEDRASPTPRWGPKAAISCEFFSYFFPLVSLLLALLSTLRIPDSVFCLPGAGGSLSGPEGPADSRLCTTLCCDCVRSSICWRKSADALYKY